MASCCRFKRGREGMAVGPLKSPMPWYRVPWADSPGSRLPHLLVNLLVHFLVGMPDADGNDSAEEVEILLPIGVPDVLIFRSLDDKRFLEEMKNSGEKMFFMRKDDVVLIHSGLA